MLILNQLAAAGTTLSVSDSRRLLLLHCEGSDTSTTFTDSSVYGRTVTPQGDAQIDTDQYKFGSSSALFDGTGDYLSVPDADVWEFDEDFTFDLWARPTDLSSGRLLFGQWTDATHGFRCGIYPTSGAIFFQIWDGVNVLNMTTSTGITAGAWNHIAVVKYGTSYKIYLDGTERASATSSAVLGNYTGVLAIGSGNGPEAGAAGRYLGHMDEFSISDLARWVDDFDPPTAAYS